MDQRYVVLDQYGRQANTIMWDGISSLSLGGGYSVALESSFTPLANEGSPYHVWSDLTQSYEISEDKLEEARNLKWEECKEYRDGVRNNGGFLVAGQYWFHSDTPSKIDQLGILNAVMLNALPPTVWSLMDGSTVTLTSLLVQQIFQTAMMVRGTNFAISRAHKTAIFASTTPHDYDFTTGAWPPIFGE